MTWTSKPPRARRVVVPWVGLAAGAMACGVEPATPHTGPLTAPFVVSDYYAPTGFMGDGTTTGLVTVKNSACADVGRPEGAQGDCYKITYHPDGAWAGVYWQYPPNNWGAKPGMKILPGAARVSFWARGTRAGEAVTFRVGGLGDETQAYHDTFSAETSASLESSWQHYSIELGARSYDAVIGAFSWTLRPSPDNRALGEVVFYLDGVTWEP